MRINYVFKTSRTLPGVLLVAAFFLATLGAAPVPGPVGRKEARSNLINGASLAQEMEPPSSTPVASISFDAVYVVNGGDGMTASISVIDTETDTVSRTIPLSNAMWPHHIYMSADRNRLLVAVPGMDLSGGHGGEMPPDMMGAVMVLDARTGATIISRMLPAMNHNAVYSPNRREIWTSQMMMPGMVLVLDANTLETRQEITVGDRPAEITFSPDGRQAYVANGMSNSVSVIDPRTKAVFTAISVGEDPVVPSQATDGHVYVDNEAGKSISVVDRRHLHVDFTYDLGFTPGMAKLGPDGHLWVTDSDNGRVVLYSPDMDVKLHEVAAGVGAHAIEFSDDGEKAYITNQHANTVSVIDVGTLAVKKTIQVGEKPNGLLFRARTF